MYFFLPLLSRSGVVPERGEKTHCLVGHLLGGPCCSVCCLCCLALALSSSASASLALLCGKTHLDYCLMRVAAAPYLLRNDGCGNKTWYEVFYRVALGQGCRIRVWICFLAICGFHLAQLCSNF